PGPQVGDRHARLDRRSARRAGHAHHTGETLGDEVVAGSLRVRPVGPEAGDAGVDDRWSDLAQRLVVDPQPGGDAGPVVLDDDVGLGDEVEEVLLVGGVTQVEDDAALVAVEGEEGRSVVALARPAPGVPRLVAAAG